MEDDLILDTSGIFTRYRNDQYDDVYAACFDIHTSKLGGKDMEDIKMKPSLDDVPGWHATYGQHQLVAHPEVEIDISTMRDKSIQSRDLRALSPIIRRWFMPSSEVRSIKDHLIDTYNINPMRTISIFYRGTDKSNETPPLPIRCCLDNVLHALEKTPDLESVLIQSDCQIMTDEISTAISNDRSDLRIIIIDEMFKSSDNKPVHLAHYDRGNVIDKLKQIQTLLAIVWIMKDCKYNIASTSFLSRWIWLYRGDRENFIQYVNGDIV